MDRMDANEAGVVGDMVADAAAMMVVVVPDASVFEIRR